jgi:hypothetical protein
MNQASRIYSVDTSALIDGLERFYRQDSFPGLWEEVDNLIHAGRFLMSDEVVEEANKSDLVAKAWCDAREPARFVVATDVVVIREVQAIVARYPNMLKKGRNRADAFVIAVARLRSAAVVTGEGHDGNERQPKIPYICGHLGIECLSLPEVVSLEGWRFRTA